MRRLTIFLSLLTASLLLALADLAGIGSADSATGLSPLNMVSAQEPRHPGDETTTPVTSVPLPTRMPTPTRGLDAPVEQRVNLPLLLMPAQPWRWSMPDGFPLPDVPAANAISGPRAELGRHLFYDLRLSGNGTQSCASCHHQDKAFTDGRAQSIGSTGEIHPRNAQTLTNVAYNATLTWANPGLARLEQQILIPIFGEFPHELGVGGREDEVLARFQNDPHYQQLFAAAYPDQGSPISWDNIVKALASFTRVLISSTSPYDRYVYGGDLEAMSPAARRGLRLFFDEALQCDHCHGGFNFSGATRQQGGGAPEFSFENNGLYNIDGKGGFPPGNTGLHEITGKPEDMGRFRPPTLRNIMLTAPYMHDGSIATLEEVIRMYEAGGRVIADGPFAGDGRANPFKSGMVGGFTLSDAERADLIAFLESLTDTQFTHDPRFSDPFARP